MHIVGLADLDPGRARAALDRTGWPAERYQAASAAGALRSGGTWVTDSAADLIAAPGLEVLIEVTGNPVAGAAHAAAAIAAGLHVVMVNVEADCLAGPVLADQAGDFNPEMFNSFLDGTKSAIEMAAVANATGLVPQDEGLLFPPVDVDDLATALRPRSAGGELSHAGTVEVVSSLYRDGREVPRGPVTSSASNSASASPRRCCGARRPALPAASRATWSRSPSATCG